MIVLGIHGGFSIRQHGASAAIIVDGVVRAFCEEERYTRVKDSYGTIPNFSIHACLKQAKIHWNDIDLIVCTGATYTDHLERLRDYYGKKFGNLPPIELVDHQAAHVAGAFYASGHKRALCLSLDGTGDGTSGLIATADTANGIKPIRAIQNEKSLGFFYNVITHYLGFTDGDEYKVMGLAPYGEANIDFEAILHGVEGDDWFLENSIYRQNPTPLSPFEPWYSSELERILGHPGRCQTDQIEQVHRDLAASAQRSLEDCLVMFFRQLKQEFPDYDTVCFSGGVALNCVANNKIISDRQFDTLYVPPIAPDRGLSLGCAYIGAVNSGDTPHSIPSAYLGNSYTNEDIIKELEHNGVAYSSLDNTTEVTAELISRGDIVGFFQGGSEAGARALGNRSILSLPGGIEMRDKVNSGIKYRENFRPFAPAVEEDSADEYFEMMDTVSPYMCVTYNTREEKRESLGAITHVDGSARVQTVSEKHNSVFSSLLKEMKRVNGTPVVLNTSFNLKGQPIVETPRDAIMTFFGCGLDHLILGDILVSKK